MEGREGKGKGMKRKKGETRKERREGGGRKVSKSVTSV